MKGTKQMVKERQHDQVILTISDLDGNVIKYSAKRAIRGTYINTETFIKGFEGISISIYDDLEDFICAIENYKKTGCKYLELLYQ